MTYEEGIGCLEGLIIGREYYVERYYRRGGMSDIYTGIRLSDDRKVIIKACSDKTGIYCKALRNEYMILGLVTSWGKNYSDEYSVPDIYDCITGGGVCCLIMEYIDGYTFNELCAGRELSDKELLLLLINVCKAVQGLHDMYYPVIHCDIKPSNIVVSVLGRVVLIDYGTANVVYSSAGTMALADGNGLGEYGTTEYAAPEQFLRQGVPDERTDIYAIGMLTRYVSGYISNKNMREKLYKIVRRCTYNDRELRYSHVSEIICELMYVTETDGLVRRMYNTAT